MRTITERSELDALEDGAVLHDRGGASPYNVWTKDAYMGWADVVWWQGCCDIPSTDDEVPLPALLIYEAPE